MRTPNHKGARPCPKKWQPRWPNFSKSEVKNMNQVILVGRLTRDPELRYTQNDTPTVRFTLAVDRPPNKDGEKVADFPLCRVYGVQATNLSKYIKKGAQIGVLGRIETGKYQNREGQTIYTTDILVDRIEYLTLKNSNTDSTRPAPGGYQPTEPNPNPAWKPQGGTAGSQQAFNMGYQT